MEISFLLQNAYGMGGTIRVTITLANYLASQGHEVELISMARRRDKPHFAIDPRVRLRTLVDSRRDRRRTLSQAVLGRFRSRALPPEDRIYRQSTLYHDLRLRRVLSTLESDVVVGTRPSFNLAIARYAPAHVVKVGQEHVFSDAHKKSLRAQMRREYPALDAFATPTDDDRRAYEKLLRRAGTRVVTIPNAIPVSVRPLSSQDEPVILAIGRMAPAKGYDRLLRAFARVVEDRPGWRLRMLGDGELRGDLRGLAADLGVAHKVAFPGKRNDVPKELASSSIHAISSHSEGFGMTILEAFSCGVPVVSFDCPRGPRALITDGEDGLLVPNGDVDALAGALLRLIDDPALRREMAARAVRTAARYDVAAIGRRWVDLLTELVVDRRTGSAA